MRASFKALASPPKMPRTHRLTEKTMQWNRGAIHVIEPVRLPNTLRDITQRQRVMPLLVGACGPIVCAVADYFTSPTFICLNTNCEACRSCLSRTAETTLSTAVSVMAANRPRAISSDCCRHV